MNLIKCLSCLFLQLKYLTNGLNFVVVFIEKDESLFF